MKQRFIMNYVLMLIACTGCINKNNRIDNQFSSLREFSIENSDHKTTLNSNQKLTPPSPAVLQQAQEASVRVKNLSTMGSGVIFAHNGQAYKVLTCKHVIENNPKHQYEVVLSTGKTYKANLLSDYDFNTIDLAVLEFQSSDRYGIVKFGDTSKLEIGEVVYASGYPNYRYIKPDVLEETYKLGTKVFKSTIGKFVGFTSKSLQGGYQLGYTNDIEQGMSGGAVFNQQGELIGINGRLKYPLEGIERYKFIDGSEPSEAEFIKMEALSWAIPTHQFLAKIKN